MPNIITARIDCTLITKSRLFTGKKKNRKDIFPQYLDVVMIPTKPTNYGDWRDEQTHMVCESVSKDERTAGVKGEILGNAVEKIGERDRRAPAAAPVAGDGPPDDGDSSIPF